MRRRPPPHGNKYSPSYWGELVDRRHLLPGWVRWMLGAVSVFMMFFAVFAVFAFLLLLLRFIWNTIAMLFGF
jgi:hypothetical protein